MNDFSKKFSLMLENGKAKKYAAIIAIFYFFIFLFSLGNLLIAEAGKKLTYEETPSIQILPDWPEKMFKEIRPFNYEAIGAIYLTSQFAFLISPMNMLLALVLSVLVGLNVLAVVFGYEQPKLCNYKGHTGILLSLSSLLTGFSCCVPTFLLLLGSSFAVFTIGAIAVISIFYPLSLIGLTLGFLLSVKKINLRA